MESSFKDRFSDHSAAYLQYRPHYPSELFQYLASLAPDLNLAWDVGTGNGQAAVGIAPFFRRVIATDPSEKQLMQALPHPKVEYRRGSAEHSDLDDESVSLVLSAQAVHWFRHEEFFREVRRVLKPEGVVAYWCYGLATLSPQLDRVTQKLYSDLLRGHWDRERKWVDEGYASVSMPFKEIPSPQGWMRAEWNFEQWMGYLRTWSAVHDFLNKKGQDPILLVYDEMKKAWGESEIREVKWELFLKTGRR